VAVRRAGVASVLALLLGMAALATTPRRPNRMGRGRIQGTVQLAPNLAARKPRIRLYADYGPGSQPPRPPPASELANVVIYLDSVPWGGEVTAPAGRLRIEQRNETFVPHVLPVVRGSTVEFPNQDPLFHNVFSLSSTRTFDLGRYPKGESKSVRFDRAGIVQVFCHIHSDMSAIVLVLDNPFFAVPADGRYAIADVPPGEYQLVAWHERIKPISQRVRVTADSVTVVDLDIPVPPPDASAQ